jgi:hypothetical protein
MTENGDGQATSRRVAILICNGFDKGGKWGPYSKTEALEYPWLDLCLRQVERNCRGWSYEVLIFDNSHLEQHRMIMERYPRVRVVPGERVARLGRVADRAPHWRLIRLGRLLERRHPKALDYLVRRVAPSAEYLVTLDTDSFPVREDWLDVLSAECDRTGTIAGVYRDEMVPALPAFIHVSGLCVRPPSLRDLDVAFGRRQSQDVGQNLTEAVVRAGKKIAPMRRSNAVNFHFLMGGLYGDIIYHHGAGSRKAQFWTSTDLEADERVRVELRNAAFRDVDHLLSILRGQTGNDLDLAAI